MTPVADDDQVGFEVAGLVDDRLGRLPVKEHGINVGVTGSLERLRGGFERRHQVRSLALRSVRRAGKVRVPVDSSGRGNVVEDRDHPDLRLRR